jgi:hypothetical protein
VVQEERESEGICVALRKLHLHTKEPIIERLGRAVCSSARLRKYLTDVSKIWYWKSPKSPDSSVNNRDGLWGSIAGKGKIFLLFILSTSAVEPTQPPIQWVPAVLSPGIKQLGREADYSPSASAEVLNGGAIPPLTHTSSWRDA